MYKERNSKIIDMIERGKSVKEVAMGFDVSTGRVHQIIKKNKYDQEKNYRINVLQTNIRMENNLKIKWKKDLIIECLKLSKIANESLNKFFQKQDVIEICLLDFMDSIITKKLKNNASLFEAIPVFGQKNIGVITMINIINSLSNCDFGDSFDNEWISRKVELKKYLVNNNFSMHMRIE